MLNKSFIRSLRLLILALAILPMAVPVKSQDVKVDPTVKPYQKVSGVSGNLSSVGSDTLVNLVTLWNEEFKKNYPGVVIQIEGKGSSTAPPALMEGTAQIGPMSREMKSEEIDNFTKKFGFAPTKIGVALDSLAVFVHKDNPIESLTIPQVDAIFSKTRLGKHAEEINTWGQLKLEGDWANKPIDLYGRNSASGTYGYFKEHALFKGDFKDSVKEQPGSAAVVSSVNEDISGIGYSGVGYVTSGVKALPLANKEGDQPCLPTYENVLAKKYPLSRMLYIYIVKDPNKPLNPTVKEFLKFALSREGQEVVIKDGFLPLPAKVIEQQLAQLEGAAK